MMTRTLMILLAVFIALMQSACTSGLLASGAIEPDGNQTADYRLGVADKVRVTVFGEPALTGEFLVGGNGMISLPLIGETQAGGLTISEFQSGVADALRDGLINDPSVSAEVVSYRPFFILGEVNSPGEYPFSSSLTVLNAVATAGGFTYRADNRNVFIKRADADGEVLLALTPNTRVGPGDTIRVRERYF